MKNLTRFAALLAILCLMPLSVAASSKETGKINDSVEVFEKIMSIPETGIPSALLKNAQGIAIIPGVIKAGFIIGGRYGSGVMAIRDNKNNWSNPSFITIAGGSVGWQIGAQSVDIILVFKTRKSVENMMKGKFTLGADAAIAAGPVGRQAEAATDIELKAEIYSYSRSRGLFAGVSIEGASLQIDDEANASFYGREAVKAQDIFTDKEIKAPPAANKLKSALSKFTSR